MHTLLSNTALSAGMSGISLRTSIYPYYLRSIHSVAWSNSHSWLFLRNRNWCLHIELNRPIWHARTTDCGAQFESYLKDAFRAHAEKDGLHWLNKLLFILLTIALPWEMTQIYDISPTQAMYGSSLKLPSDLFQLPADPYTSYDDISDYCDKLASFMRIIPPAISRNVTSKSQIDKNLYLASHMLIKNNTRSGV